MRLRRPLPHIIHPTRIPTHIRPGIDLDKLMRYGYDDVHVVHRVFGSACYIDSAMPR